jgi:hypothetical protein
VSQLAFEKMKTQLGTKASCLKQLHQALASEKALPLTLFQYCIVERNQVYPSPSPSRASLVASPQQSLLVYPYAACYNA